MGFFDYGKTTSDYGKTTSDNLDNVDCVDFVLRSPL